METVDHKSLANDFKSITPPARVYTDDFRRLTFSVDASMFFREALIVGDALNEKEVAALLSYS